MLSLHHFLILKYSVLCRFGGILLHADRFKHINNVARIVLQETGLGQKVLYSMKKCMYSRLNLCDVVRLTIIIHFHLLIIDLQHKLEAIDSGKAKGQSKTSTRTKQNKYR